jgi:hypothetical protein
MFKCKYIYIYIYEKEIYKEYEKEIYKETDSGGDRLLEEAT